MERERTSALPQVDHVNTMVKTHYPDGGETEYTSSSVTDAGYATMTDHVIDNYHARSKNGEIFINPMYKHLEAETRPPLNLDINYDFGGRYDPYKEDNSSYVGKVGDNWGGYFPYYEIPSGIAEHLLDLKQIALTSAFAGATVQKASALVTIGESKETVSGVVDVFLRLLKILTLVKKHQYRTLRKEFHPSEIADFWMEIRYGIRPLVFDFQQIVDALKDTTEVGDRLTSRGFESYTFDDTDVFTNLLGNYDLSVDRSFSLQYSCRAGVLSQVDRIGLLSLFGVADIPGAIWDLSTLSFVVDWFFNVGDTIAAATPEAALTTLGAWTVETTKVKQTVTSCQMSNLSKNAPTTVTSGTLTMSDPWVKSYTTVVRTPQTRASFLPRFTLNLNWAKVIDLSIIGRNIVKSLRSNDKRISRHGRLIRK